ncbi:MAG: hypothetical protein ABIQ73_05590 [Acidimicrobiales bacterium]
MTAHATPGGYSSSGDYATEELGDPWDFSNDADWDFQARAESANISNASVSGGTLKYDAAAQGGVLIGSAHYGSHALQWGSSTWLRPIVASNYSTIVMRMRTSLSGQTPAGLSFYTCGETVPTCNPNMSFLLDQGWQTYTFPVGAAQGWTGNVYGLRVFAAAAGSFEIDYIRVLRNGGSAAPVTEPIPNVLDPDRAGGADYAANVRGNAWDFNGPDDVADYANINNISFANGSMHACSTNNDPGFILPIAEPIDGNWYNRLSVRIFYEGGFSLADAPGGGMNARVLFRTAGLDFYQISQDIVVYPGWNDIDLELGTNPPNAVLEEGTGGPGWGGQQITEIRFDPHEDRGVRCFTVDDIKLSAVDTATPGFAVKFRDDAQGIGAPSGGTTAEVWLDTNRGTFGGTRVGNGIAVQTGVNTFNFGGGLPTGFYWVWVRLTDGNGRQSSAYSRAPLLVGAPQPRPGGSTTDVNAGVGGSAALVNLTMTAAQRAGYLTADRDCAAATAARNSKSNGNYTPGQDIANLGVIPLDNGHFCLYNNAPVHEIADVQGVFSGNGNLSFSEFAPARFDTRRLGRPGAGAITEVSTGAPGGTEAVLVNLTMTEADSAGYITADRCSTLRADTNADKQFSNGNYVVGSSSIANLAVVRIDTDGTFCIFTKTPVNVIADIQGRFAPSGTMKFATSSSNRFDTRGGARPASDSTTTVVTGLAPGTPYALVNLTMTGTGGGGYITADRDCATARAAKFSKSNGNFVGGRDIANLSVVPLAGDGSFCIYTEIATHLVVDVQGSFSPSNSLGFALSGPSRQLDTRR